MDYGWDDLWEEPAGQLFLCKMFVIILSSYLLIAAWIAFWIASGVNQFLGITYCINLFVGIIYDVNLFLGIVSQPVLLHYWVTHVTTRGNKVTELPMRLRADESCNTKE